MLKQVHYLDYYNSLLEGNKERCADIIRSLIEEGTDLKEIYTELFQKSLYQIGNLWDKSKLTIPEEHLATQITESLISRFSPSNGKNKTDKKALITCVDKEYHELGAKMAANIFEMNGWQSFFLGASVPAKEILKFIKLKEPDMVGISFSLYLNLLRFTEVIDHIKKIFPDLKIIVGGQALKEDNGDVLKKYPDIKYFESILDLDSYLKEIS